MSLYKNKNSPPVTTLGTIGLMWCRHTPNAIATESRQNTTECTRIQSFTGIVLATNAVKTNVNRIK